MKFNRLFTTPTPIQDQIKWKTVSSEIKTSDGTRIFYMPEVEVPSHWNQGPTNILAQKYFRKAGVPQGPIEKISEKNIPLWLWPSKIDKHIELGSESSAKQVFHRLAGAWTYWGWKEGIFFSDTGEIDLSIQGRKLRQSEEYAQIFYDEIYYMLAMQFAAPNSPQWFNTGLNWAYGITGNANGQWAVNDKGEVFESPDSYTYSQPHACFIQPITDSLVTPGGIMDLWSKEARLFKQGSGTGTNFSSIRGKGEPLSGGGKSSGLMSFLKIGDVVAGSIASGGTTRRAAKMCCLDLDHPEIEEFIEWKMKEEAKAAALYVGSQILNDEFHGKNGLLGGKEYIPAAMIDRFSNDIEPEVCDLGFEGIAMSTVDGQNANDSIRITDKFLAAVDGKHNWPLIARTTGKIVKVLKSEELWQKICRAAWACADPGLQFHDTINLWHTCKSDGDINASNPCSEYMFLDDTACNLASLNLGKFLINGEFDIKSFQHATRIWTTILEISVFMASFPSKEIARNSYLYRTLGLGYANAGGILMRLGLPYDSDKSRDYIAGITALMHANSYLTSNELAKELSPFSRWENNKESMTEVVQNHASLTQNLNGKFRDFTFSAWSNVDYNSGFRNAQVTLIAPTGTIALLMNCDTTGIEPDFSLVKYKYLSGEGMMKIVNECVPEALKTLGYTPAQIMSITQHITDNDTIEGWTVNGQPMPEEHLKVFDCAVPGGNGIRSLDPMAHVKMVAAVQPFLSGAVSKTVNMPNSATISDVDNIYREAHRLGLKAIAIYRDGSKLTQPLNTGQKKIISEDTILSRQFVKPNTWTKLDLGPPLCKHGITPSDCSICEDEYKAFKLKEGRVPDNDLFIAGAEAAHKEWLESELKPATQRGKRLRLPPRTTGYRQKFIVDGQSIYLRTGEYEDGSLGEIFIDFSREGSLVRALINSIGKLTSIGLQYGVPLSALVNAFVYTKFEPSGIVIGHDRIKLCTSPLDLIFRDLAIHYLGMEEFANVEPPSPNRSEGRVPEPEPGIWIFRDLENPNIIKDEYGNVIKNPLYCILDKDNTMLCPGPGMTGCGRNCEYKDHSAPAPDSTTTQDSRILSGHETPPSFRQTIINQVDTILSSTTYETVNMEPVKPLTTIRLKHGDACQLCGHYPTLRTGTCITCPNCHANSGCG